MFEFIVLSPGPAGFLALIGYVVGIITGFIMFRKKFKLKVLYISEDFADILKQHGLPGTATVEEAQIWLVQRLQKAKKFQPHLNP